MTYIRDIKISSPITSFGNIPVSERTAQIELKSIYGISDIRDYIAENGVFLDSARSSTKVTHAGAGAAPEYRLETGASASQSLKFESAEKGRYQPGFSAECGIGVRHASATRVGDQVSKWGYFDQSNGFYFKLDANGLSVNVLRGGVETSVPRSEWNGDKLDGTGESGITLDLTDGNIYQVTFAWYGYGSINFEIIISDEVSEQRPIIVHRIRPREGTSLIDPNLPISASMDNGSTAATQVMFVAGRQFSILGKYQPTFRITSERRLQQSIGTTLTPIMSFRRKAAFNSVAVQPQGYSVLAITNSIIIEVRTNGVLTGASFATPNGVPTPETALEVDISATALTGGRKVFESVHPAGQGSTKSLSTTEITGIITAAQQPITILARTISGSATIDTVMSILEEW